MHSRKQTNSRIGPKTHSRPVTALLLVAALTMPACHFGQTVSEMPDESRTVGNGAIPDPLAPITPAVTLADRIVNRAKEEARRGVFYDASYRKIHYPGGDVPADCGACTDVVVRSLRAAGVDLQKSIHEDMTSHYDLYPNNWDIRHPDSNIDHRRVPNHVVFLRRHTRALTIKTGPAELSVWKRGDIVYWKLDSGLDHCGIISNVRNAMGVPLVIHNISGARQEDCLTKWKITAHFRYPVR